MAYWINLYNALVVRLVVDHYPIASIRDIGKGADASGVGPWRGSWSRSRARRCRSSDIAHRILRPIWRDPRVHYALACGAVSCPNLQPEPFYADQLDRQLSEAAMAYVNDRRCIRIEGDQLGLSSLYRWYRDDFGPTDQDVINHLMAYAAPNLAMKLQGFDRITDDGFDWRLNDATLLAHSRFASCRDSRVCHGAIPSAPLAPARAPVPAGSGGVPVYNRAMTRPLFRPALHRSLSARLLVLTFAFVLLAEVLIYVPSIARFRRVYLEERIAPPISRPCRSRRRRTV